MKASQKTQLAISETRGKLNELVAKEDRTEGETKEMEELTKRFQALEVELRAALTAESQTEETKTIPKESENKEAEEKKKLLSRCSIGVFMRAAAQGNDISVRSPEYELRQAFQVEDSNDGVKIPWALLDPAREKGYEKRTTTDTASGAANALRLDGIIARVFDTSPVFNTLGVESRAVPTGKFEYALVSAGASPAQKAEGATTTENELTFTLKAFNPKRAQAAMRVSRELLATTEGVENAMRRDINDALMQHMSNHAINGDGAGEEVEGFIGSTTLAAVTNPTAKTSAVVLENTAVNLVDGLHANRKEQINLLIGDETYRAMGSLVDSTLEGFALDILMQRAGTINATTLIPDPATVSSDKVQQGVAYKNGASASRSAVAAVWGGGPTLIRDIYTRALEGEIRISVLTLWDMKIVRPLAYKRLKFRF